MTTSYSYMIGSTVGGLTNVESLLDDFPAPRSYFKHYQEAQKLGSGKTRGAGYPGIVWYWGFLTQAQRDRLRQFCSVPSATVYIQSVSFENSDTYAIYQATMNWPQEEERDTTRRLEFRLEFTYCIVQES